MTALGNIKSGPPITCTNFDPVKILECRNWLREGLEPWARVVRRCKGFGNSRVHRRLSEIQWLPVKRMFPLRCKGAGRNLPAAGIAGGCANEQ